MKATASKDNAAGTRQKKRSRRTSAPGAATGRRATNAAASASRRATDNARRGEPLPAERKSDRSPKQENL